MLDVELRADDKADDHRQADQDERHVAVDMQPLPGRHLTAPGPAAERRGRTHDGDEERNPDRARALLDGRPRDHQAAIAEIGEAEEGNALPGAGEHRKHGLVPEQQLQEQRDVAEELDVDGRDLADDPVMRQPRRRR